MSVVVNTVMVRRLMDAQGLDMSGLARACRMSRQGVYRLLGDDYRPLGRGFQALAKTLGVSPLTLLEDPKDDAETAELINLVEQSAAGEPRAFEMLPAHLHHFASGSTYDLGEQLPVHHQLLAAAAEVAADLTSSETLRACARFHTREREVGRAFFFASRFMTAERIVTSTPQPMQAHLVFGSFEMSSFARHL